MENLFEQVANISKAGAYDILVEQVKELTAENEKLKALERSFYMDVCRAYNAGKQNFADCVQCYADNDSGESKFKSSHDYFIGEFPTFKINVP